MVGIVNYFSNGSRSSATETVEILGDVWALPMGNFRVVCGYGFTGFMKFKTNCRNKGHNVEIAAFVDGSTSGSAPLISFAVLSNITHASLAAVELTQMKKTTEPELCLIMSLIKTLRTIRFFTSPCSRP